MGLFELYRYDINLMKQKTASDTSQVPAGALTCKFYREGATASAVGTVAASSSGTVSVYDPGAIAVNDTVQVNADPTLGVGTVTAITATGLTITATTSIVLAKGDRLVVTNNQPLTYVDDQGTEATPVASTVTTDPTSGGAFAYCREHVVDLIFSGTGVTARVIPDQVGVGQGMSVSPMDWCAKFNGTTDDATAWNQAIAYVKVKGGGVIELPPGVTVLGSTITITDVPGLTIRGQGQGVTTVKMSHTATGFNVTGTSSDFLIERMTIDRTGTSASPVVFLATGSTGPRAKARDLHLISPGSGVGVTGDDADVRNITMSGGGASFSYVVSTVGKRTAISNVMARYATNPASGGIVVASGAESPRITNCDISPASITGNGGVGLLIATGVAPPKNVMVSACRFVGGTTVNPSAAVQITGCSGAHFVGCDLEDSEIGYDINGGTNIKIMGGTTVGINRDGIDIDGGSYIHIVEHTSSNVDLLNSSKDHVNIAAGVDDVYINGLVVGRMLRGTGTQKARYGVAIEAGDSFNIQVVGLRGLLTDLQLGYISNLSTSHNVDFGHNLETGINRTFRHGMQNTEGIGNNVYGLIYLQGTETTCDVRNVSTVVFEHSAPTTFTDMTFAAHGQQVMLIFRNGNTTITQAGTFDLDAAAATFTSTARDTMLVVWDQISGKWLEVCRSVN